MNTMVARRKRSLFPLRPRPLPPGRHLSAATFAAVCTLLFLVLVLLSTTPSTPRSRHRVINRRSSSSSPPRPPHPCGAASIGDLGDAMVSMLPKDLPFTVFVPSADAFRRVLNLRPENASSARATDAGQAAGNDGDDTDDGNTYAVLSRVLGFSAVPQRLLAANVPPRGRVSVLESVSGLRIHVARDEARGAAAALVANGVRSECVDVVRVETVVHVMAGVLMDAEFERSFSVGI